MADIRVLPKQMAELIAAGEVVERPASVIKELCENSIDAGATKITVEIQNGGVTYMRVTDNGSGIEPEDLPIAVRRHATSKIREADDLEAIMTLGFRGEALAAISAVSRIDMVTREQGAEQGIRVILEAGDIQNMEECGCPYGTTITVRDLFYNTPARRKFLKTERSETTSCTQTAVRCALSRPDISMRSWKNWSGKKRKRIIP